MRIWIKSPLAIFVDEGLSADNGIVIEDKVITELVPSGANPQSEIDKVFDASAHVVLPGLINTHHHYYQTLTRAVPASLNKGLFPWLKSLYPIWAGLTEEMIHVSTRLATIELMLSGCTTSVDHHYLYTDSSISALDNQVEAIRATGIRSVLTRGSMSVGVSKGGLPPDNTTQDQDTILNDSERVIHQYHDSSRGSMLNIALAPCSPFSVSKELMVKSQELAQTNKVRLHTHLAETEDESDYCASKFGCRPLQYLEEVNWLNHNTWVAHGIHFNDEEIEKLGRCGTGVSHCPTSNMMLGSGHCKVLDLKKQGSPVGLGVDGSASNDCSNMIQELRQAFLLQRLNYGSDKFSHRDAIEMATKGSAACIGRNDIGEIAVGKQADISMFKLDELKFSGAGDSLAALILCNADRVDELMIAGEWKVRHGLYLGEDLDKLKHLHTQLSRRLQSTH